MDAVGKENINQIIFGVNPDVSACKSAVSVTFWRGIFTARTFVLSAVVEVVVEEEVVVVNMLIVAPVMEMSEKILVRTALMVMAQVAEKQPIAQKNGGTVTAQKGQ